MSPLVIYSIFLFSYFPLFYAFFPAFIPSFPIPSLLFLSFIHQHLYTQPIYIQTYLYTNLFTYINTHLYTYLHTYPHTLFHPQPGPVQPQDDVGAVAQLRQPGACIYIYTYLYAMYGWLNRYLDVYLYVLLSTYTLTMHTYP